MCGAISPTSATGSRRVPQVCCGTIDYENKDGARPVGARALSDSVCKRDREGIQLCPVLRTVIMGPEKRTMGSNGTAIATEDALSPTDVIAA